MKDPLVLYTKLCERFDVQKYVMQYKWVILHFLDCGLQHHIHHVVSELRLCYWIVIDIKTTDKTL
jgi:hypothetical protein